MQIIGLTGGIASGKSTALKYISLDHSLAIIDADKIAKEVLALGTNESERVKSLFPSVTTDDGGIDRDKLGRIIFSDPIQRKSLEAIVHPAVRLRIFGLLCWYWINGYERVVLDIPLLFESGLDCWMSETFLVYCTKDQQIQRLMKRNNISAREAKERVECQWPIEKKILLADTKLDNRHEIGQLHDEIDEKFFASKPNKLVHKFAYYALPLTVAGVTLLKVAMLLNKR